MKVAARKVIKARKDYHTLRSEEHTSELQSLAYLVCRLLLEKKNVLDVCGGSVMFAVPLSRLGHDVTVVYPSADALATMRRRAGPAGVGERGRGVHVDGDLLH